MSHVLNPEKCKFASHFPLFFFSEISRLQAGGSKGAGFKDPIKYVDVYRERPIRLTVRVLVPVREHPKVRNILKFTQQSNVGRTYCSYLIWT